MTSPQRYWCQVLDEMRDHLKALNFSMFPSFIEELQTMGNRMEAGLYYKGDLDRIHNEISELRKKRDELESEIEELEAAVAAKAKKKPARRK